MYAVKNCAPAFRLGIALRGIFTNYEAEANPKTKVGKDHGMVIDFLKEEDAATVLGTFEKDRAVNRFDDAILDSSVDQGSRD